MQRIDIYLAEKKYCISRNRAKELIKLGLVTLNGKIVDKCSIKVDESDEIFVKDDIKYVSRAGLKLKEAISEFKIDLDNKICMDIGASTGGFTEVLLECNAKLIYAIDVGTNQLSKKLLSNKKVISIENQNFRYYDNIEIYGKIDFITIDVSFISLKKIILNTTKFLANDGEMVVLIKPQFEVGREFLNKNGIVNNIKLHKQVLTDIENEFLINGLYVERIIQSPIKGSDGNIEYLAFVKRK